MSKDPYRALVVDDMIPEHTRLFRWEVDRQRLNHTHRPMIQGRRQEDTMAEGFHRGGIQILARALYDLGLTRTSVLVDEHFHDEFSNRIAAQERLPEGPDGKGRLNLRLRPIVNPQGLGSQGLRGEAPLLLAESDLLLLPAPEGLLDLLGLGVRRPGAALRSH